MTQEKQRLEDANREGSLWKKWGPYLAERQWGTVREDYSPDGTAWEYFPHDHARSRAYRWGEDGIAGFSDDQQLLCFALALWNGKDPILKERLFGLTGNEGNHGEDVKEYYYYLDSTPTHSYMKTLYKYPQGEFPYRSLFEENRRRGKGDPEFELIETGIFDEDRYFDVFCEFAKQEAEDTLIRITVHNRGPEEAEIHVLPQIWFRNTWAWEPGEIPPELRLLNNQTIEISHDQLGKNWLYCAENPEFLFCDNDTNGRRILGEEHTSGYFKDGINDFVVGGIQAAVNPDQRGTKAAAHYPLTLGAGASQTLMLRLTNRRLKTPFSRFDEVFRSRSDEADEFYGELQEGISDDDARNVQRQAFAGMLWSKQFYYYDVPTWLKGDPLQPPPPAGREHGRNSEWVHLNNADLISMPDKWEYPWYAAWDLAFHCLPLAMVDAEFAKHQLVLLTREWYMHPNGQVPAYEWAFGDVNPPVHAWATWRVYKIDKKRNSGQGDLDFLERVFHKLLLNFTWWVNRKDADGNNIFQGGFLGLDNIGVFDRSAELPTGGHIEQSDATGWMAMYSLNLMRIALELSVTRPIYQDIASKFFEHFLLIAKAMTDCGCEGINLWDEEDGFYYDVLHAPASRPVAMKVRSLVGLIPLFAVETLEPGFLDQVPEFKERLEWVMENRPELAALVSRWHEPGVGERRLLSLLRGHRMKMILKRALDEAEFLSPFGIRSISKYHKENPYTFRSNGQSFSVSYEPAESRSGVFGGNSNWRGPIWFPVNFLIVESLQKFHHYYGDDFKIEYPTGSGDYVTIEEAANDLSRRLSSIFLLDEDRRRPFYGNGEKTQTDPNFRDYILFHEYFHGDDGSGLGASHQTGWTGLVAKLLQPRPKGNPE